MSWPKVIFAVLILSTLALSACGQEDGVKAAKCNGCFVNGRCLDVGVRLSGQYCWVDGELKPQKQNGEQCENTFECKDSPCTAGKCQKKEEKDTLTWVYEEIKDWITHIFRVALIKRI